MSSIHAWLSNGVPAYDRQVAELNKAPGQVRGAVFDSFQKLPDMVGETGAKLSLIEPNNIWPLLLDSDTLQLTSTSETNTRFDVLEQSVV